MNLARFIRTVRHLRIAQILHRLWWPFRRVAVGTEPAPVLTPPAGRMAITIPSKSGVEGEQQFRLLNQSIEIDSQSSWNDESRDKLLLYHLHYHEVLNCRSNFADAEAAARFLQKWIEDNPPTGGNGWEPYPISRRIVNWVKWCGAGNALSERALQSLWLQARVLSQTIEYHVLANHLLANAKALFFAGTIFDGEEADRWLAKGQALLESAVEEQILGDGGHFERSPMYQATVLEDFLDVLNICRSYKLKPPAGVISALPSMLQWLASMTHPDGHPAYFNDTTNGVAPSLAELRRYAENLGVHDGPTVSQGLSHLSESGYLRFQGGDVAAFIDVGEIGPDFQPGHAHCDCLSFELSLGAQRVFVNTGISTYNDNARRHTERGTAAHNTVSIDGAEQSEIWGAFRVGRRARPVEVDAGERHVSAAHDGFKRLDVMHRRRFDIYDDRMEIRDTLEGPGSVTGVAHFHCHPDLEPVIDGRFVVIGGVQLTLDGAEATEIRTYEYCDGFNDRRSAKEIAVTFRLNLTSRIHYEDSLHIR